MSQSSRRRALLVDDEPVIRQALRRWFQRSGWSVDEAEDGRAALARLIPGDPDVPTYDVIVTDLRMPGVSGMELYTRLERERPDLARRVIFSTGDTLSPDAAAFLERTSCPVLHKPFALGTLRTLVAEVLDR